MAELGLHAAFGSGSGSSAASSAATATMLVALGSTGRVVFEQFRHGSPLDHAMCRNSSSEGGSGDQASEQGQ